jgi:CRISPR-associated protein Cmr5
VSGPSRAAESAPKGSNVTRDQRFALHAYKAVASVEAKAKKDYKIAVYDFGTNVLRSGLAAAVATLERRDDKGVKFLREHLAMAGIVGLKGVTAETLPDRVRDLDIDEYIMATRELLHLTLWLKRAVQATIKDSSLGVV